VRRRLGAGVKVGHAGTLDPFATGLLLVLVGRATRVQRFLMALPKRYEAVARLGFTSTTGDRDGELAPGRMPREPLVLPTGRLRQRPPAYSAVKVGGRRAYELARAGETVELAEREVEVTSFELAWREGDRAGLVVECSSGTYVRTLVSDLGDAYCKELRRTAIGPFDVADADPDRIVPLGDALGFLPAVTLAGEDARKAAHGVAVAAPGGTPSAGPGGPLAAAPKGVPSAEPLAVRLVDGDGLIALAEPREDGLLKPVVGFRG
jgi:tRNA pseudouridine55 synthase